MSALGLGIAHAFEPDHMAAVSTFVAARPTPREAARFGFKWAIGHGLSMLALGAALYLLKRAIHQPALFSSGVLDRVVGVVLLGLGVWMAIQLRTGVVLPRTLRGWKYLLTHGARLERTLEEQLMEQQASTRFQRDAIEHEADLPLFGAPNAHATRAALPGKTARVVTRAATPAGNGSLWMGMLHGAAGTGAFVGQAAMSLSQSYTSALLYTILFSIGVLLSMSFYSTLLGSVLTWGQGRSAKLLRGARWATSMATCVIGLCLIGGVELPGFFDWLHSAS